MAGESLNRIDDTVLVREAQRGDRAAFEDLVRRYDQAVLRLALRLTGSEHEAQDIYQEAFLKAYRNVGSFRSSVRSIPGSTALLQICASITCAASRCARKMRA